MPSAVGPKVVEGEQLFTLMERPLNPTAKVVLS